MTFDGESSNGLSGFGDSIDDLLRPNRFDSDDHARRDIRILSGSDQRIEMKLEVFTELQASIWMRQRHRTLNMAGDSLASGVRQIVQRKNDNIIAAADAAVLSLI